MRRATSVKDIRENGSTIRCASRTRSEFASVAGILRLHFNASFNAFSRDHTSAARTVQWCSARQDELPQI
ncbi:hypothetical protein K438DRAFT_401703 [Mycena galopus ATCC 62051]|nr:hypothetical protein K438DRAFT_401703 [Mycena galopus ATCC 62051]